MRESIGMMCARQHVTRGLFTLCAAWALAIGMWSCALPQAPPREEVVGKARPSTTTIPPGWTPASTVAEDVKNDWLKTFNDSGLEAIVNEAIAHNSDLRKAAATVEVAWQSAALAGARLKPQAGLSAGASITQDKDQDDPFRSSSVLVQVAWELDIWGRVRSERAGAIAAYQATALDYAFARQSLAAATAHAWYLAIETRQLVDLSRQSVQIFTTLLDLAKAKFAAGNVSGLDVAEATAVLNEGQAELARAQGLYSDARRALEVLAGRFPSAELEVASNYAPLPQPVAAGLPTSLLERRPDILAAESEVVAAFRALNSARLALLPSIVLTAEGGRLSNRILDVLKLNPYLIATGFGLFQPIFEGGALRTQIKIESARQEQAIANYATVALTAFREVAVALNNERVLAEQLQYQNQALANRAEAVRIATVRYRAGALALQPVLQLQADQLATEAGIIRLRDAQLANRVTLHLALGGGFDAAPAAAVPSDTHAARRDSR
jgi:NodT family efflux transporter outer membrane factor (OMF) lipoprotein